MIARAPLLTIFFATSTSADLAQKYELAQAAAEVTAFEYMCDYELDRKAMNAWLAEGLPQWPDHQFSAMMRSATEEYRVAISDLNLPQLIAHCADLLKVLREVGWVNQ